jgi:hypothetical protein
MPKATLNKKLVCVLLPKMAIRVFARNLRNCFVFFQAKKCECVTIPSGLFVAG